MFYFLLDPIPTRTSNFNGLCVHIRHQCFCPEISHYACALDKLSLPSRLARRWAPPKYVAAVVKQSASVLLKAVIIKVSLISSFWDEFERFYRVILAVRTMFPAVIGKASTLIIPLCSMYNFGTKCLSVFSLIANMPRLGCRCRTLCLLLLAGRVHDPHYLW